MAIYVSILPYPIVIDVGIAVYRFDASEYYPANAELLPYAGTQLVSQPDVSALGLTQASRAVKFTSDAADVSALALQTTAAAALKEATEAAHHPHSYEHWFGIAAVPTPAVRADHDTMTPFVADGGNDTWGVWLNILGTADTPHLAGMTKYDCHRLLFTDFANAGKIHRAQFAFGASGAAALTAETYTEFMIQPVAANIRSVPVNIQHARQDAGTPAWFRVWADGENGSLVDFFIGVHEYVE